MTCLEAQSKIIAYIENKLERNDKQEFLIHVKNCKECREELNIYYTMIEGMRQLDENEPLSKDFDADLERRMSQELNTNRKKKDAYASRKSALRDFLDKNQYATSWYVIKENRTYSVICFYYNDYKVARQGMTLKELVKFVTYARLGFIQTGKMLKENFVITDNMTMYSLLL